MKKVHLYSTLYYKSQQLSALVMNVLRNFLSKM